MSQPPSQPAASRHHEFQTTSWSLVARAGTADPNGREAMEHLCRVYWPPLYAFLRGMGQSRTDAEDLVQGFFVHLLEKKVLGYADPRRGRFRTFLIAAIKQFASREHARATAQQRQPGERLLSLDFGQAEEVFRLRGRPEESPEHLFDRVWAFTLLEQTRNTLCDEYDRAGKSQLFKALSPALNADAQPAYHELAADLQMSEGAVRVAVHRLKQRYGTTLRRLIAETVLNESEIDEELDSLMRAIGS